MDAPSSKNTRTIILVALAFVPVAALFCCSGGAVLVLPAIQHAREAMRRQQVQNNLRQLGEAIIYAFEKTGLLVTEENPHLLSGCLPKLFVSLRAARAAIGIGKCPAEVYKRATHARVVSPDPYSAGSQLGDLANTLTLT